MGHCSLQSLQTGSWESWQKLAKLKRYYELRGKEKHCEATVKGFTKTFQRNAALKHRNLFISILVEYLSIKKQTEDNIAECLVTF